jgi:serine protease Do
VSESAAKRLGSPAQRGALIVDVEEDSPAAEAKLEKDDIVLAFDGERIRSTAHLSRLVQETPPGRTVEIEVLRSGISRMLTATVKEGGMSRLIRDFEVRMRDSGGHEMLRDTPHESGPDARVFRFHGWGAHDAPSGLKLGIRYQELSDQLAQYFGVQQGVLVAHVEQGSAAERAGIQAGDVLQEVAGQPVPDGYHLQRALRQAENGKSIKLQVLRRGESHELEVGS